MLPVIAMEETYYALNPWWEGKDFDSGIPRPEYTSKLSKLLKRKQINVIIGSRRVGKTTVLKQLIKDELKHEYLANTILYLALDHPQLSATPLSEHLRNFRKTFNHSRDRQLLLFFDEIQESPSWESELKSIFDLENVKIVSTGSTSSLLKTQGGKLTGRQNVTTIYPLSFREFLSFKKLELSLAEEYRYESLAEEYLQTGGYPENVLMPSPEYLANLLEDIIARDLLRLFQIRRADVLRDLFRLLAASVGSRTSFSKLARALGISVDTVREYIGYFETAFLVKPMEKWTTSYTEKVYAAKKMYLLDTGLKTLVTGKGDLGAKAENAVFLHFLRKNETCGYFAKHQKEVDFVLGSIERPLPVEVKYDSDLDWQNRRFSGLKIFLKEFPQTKEAIVVSKSGHIEFQEKPAIIKAIPLWKFLLD
ncbi:MAG TPA: hypothetical protein DCW86_02320 [Actinobacteria bacterium]|nr:hypothetical protein [Actinomycetota bacterium]